MNYSDLRDAHMESLLRNGCKLLIARYSSADQNVSVNRPEEVPQAPELLATLDHVASALRSILVARYPEALGGTDTGGAFHWHVADDRLEHTHRITYRDTLTLPAALTQSLQPYGVSVADGEYSPGFVGFSCFDNTDNLVDVQEEVGVQLAACLIAHLDARELQWLARSACTFRLALADGALEYRHKTMLVDC